MIEKVTKEVHNLLKNDDTGHGIDHVNRVLKLALQFAQDEKADIEIVTLIALLHDVDDYKLFGEKNACELTNAKMIMKKANVHEEIQKRVINDIECIGYKKSLNGIRPKTIEGMIVSDADMCDALGINGILRTYQYCLKYGKPFFDKTIYPTEYDGQNNMSKIVADTGVCHLFEKILKLKNMMLTKSGQREAISRHEIVLKIMYQLFDEENVPEWADYLDEYCHKNKC